MSRAFLPALLGAVLLGLPRTVSAVGVTGSAQGFATGVTGGGSVAAAYPTDISQLKTWLTDSTPRTIMIDKEYDFTGSEGTCTNCAGCIPSSNTCGSSGQNAIDLPGQTWCDPYPSTPVTYDKAGIAGIYVNSHKSIVGVGSSAVFKGKGLRFQNVTNIIVQNIAITDLNPSLIWGGDAITLDGTDLIWIDHCTINLIGRQFIVTGYDNSGRVTISNNEFDGRTSWSATCDGHHYWTLLGYGDGDQITLMENYIHDTSGRSPKVEYNSLWHAVNNYWLDNSGHAFDVGQKAQVLIEGNQFDDVNTPMVTDSSPGQTFVPTSSTTGDCTASLGRACQINSLFQSGTLAASDTDFLVDFKGHNIPSAMAASAVKKYVKSHAGVGNL